MNKYEELKRFIEKEYEHIKEEARGTDYDQGYLFAYELIMCKVRSLEREP